MKYLLLFLPTIAWGIMPLFSAGVKNSTVYNQILGTVLGSFIFGLGAVIIDRPSFDTTTMLWSMVAGGAWTIGMIGQYMGFANIGVSETMPISTGLQLIGVPIVGVLAFGEWSSPTAKIFGFLGIVALVIGVIFTSFTDEGTNEGNKKNQTSTLIILIVTTLGFIAVSSIPKALTGSNTEIFFGETLGELIVTMIYLVSTKQLAAFKDKLSYRIIPAGIIFGIGSSTYILSVNANGVNLAFIMSQLCVVISTFCGILFLHERKTKKGYISTGLGLVMIIAGAVLTTLF